ncbi:MAG: hypothetical protein ACREOR_06600 [Candidatus Binatia bacterium]
MAYPMLCSVRTQAETERAAFESLMGRKITRIEVNTCDAMYVRLGLDDGREFTLAWHEAGLAFGVCGGQVI